MEEENNNNLKVVKRIISEYCGKKEYCEELYANKLENSEMGKS